MKENEHREVFVKNNIIERLTWILRRNNKTLCQYWNEVRNINSFIFKLSFFFNILTLLIKT